MHIPNRMLPLSRLVGLAVSLCAGIVTTHVIAQVSTSSKFICASLGGASGEPIGDRPGHSIQVTRPSCRVEGGLLDGGLAGINGVFEFDGPIGTHLSGDGVIRKQGAMAAFKILSGTVTLTMTGGAPSGWTYSGKGVFTMATGTASALNGKTFSIAVRPIGPGQSQQDWVMD